MKDGSAAVAHNLLTVVTIPMSQWEDPSELLRNKPWQECENRGGGKEMKLRILAAAFSVL
jgi:hypothetical protein